MAAVGKCLGGDPQMSQARLIVGLIIILLGVNILFDLSLVKILFSLFVIWLGVRVLTGNQGKWSVETKTRMHEDVLKRVILFSKFDTRLLSQDFKKAELVIIFGASDVDLSEVKTKQPSVDLDCVAIFGALKMRVPKSWSVKSDGVGMIGAFTNQAKPPVKKAVEANLKGVAIFGGVNIVN